MPSSRWCLLLLCTLWIPSASAEDWPTARHDVQASGQTAEQIDAKKLKPLWTFHASQPPAPAWTAPAKWDAYAFVRGLRAMRRYDAAFPFIVVKESIYYASSVDDSIHCLNAKTGKVQWTFTTNAPIRVAPFHKDGRLYFGSDDGRAWCISANDGTAVWEYRFRDEQEQLILNNGRFISQWPCRTGVVVDNGIAYCAFSMLPWNESYLCALDVKTGKPKGKGCFVRKLSNVTLEGSLLLTKDHIIATQGRVPPAIFQRADGKLLGNLGGGGGSFLTLTDKGETLHGPGNKTGWIVQSNLQSRRAVSTHRNRTAAVVNGDVIYFLSDTKVAAWSQSKRKMLWEVNGRYPHDIILAGDTLFVGGEDVVAALATKDGEILWQSSVQGRAHRLAVANGVFYASTDEGVIHAFDTNPKDNPARRASEGQSQPDAQARGNIPPRPVKDPDLLQRWVFHSGMSAFAKRRGLPNADKRVQDLAGKLHGTVHGKMQLQPIGSVEALVCDGSSTSVRIVDDHSKVTLPEKEITVEAWVRVDRPLQWGGIACVVQDNGSYEHGWVLGYVNSNFSFAINGKGGPNRLTYLSASKGFETEQWYHVVGTYDGTTQKVYVNGKLSASSKEQTGPISYPPKAFYELGAYHDANEFYRLQGMLHEVRTYKLALTAKEIQEHYVEKRRQFPIAMDLPFGPAAYFTSPTEAKIFWHTDAPSPTRLTLLTSSSQMTLTHRDRVIDKIEHENLKTKHEVTLTGLRRERVYHYQIATQSKDGQGQTAKLELDTHFNYHLPDVAELKSPFAKSWATDAVKEIARRSKTQQGICLVIGCEDGQMLWEIAKQTQMRIIGVDTDAKKIASIRKSLLPTGIYGARISVMQVSSLKKLPFVSDFANLITSETTAQKRVMIGDANEAYRVLRPNGGVVLMGQIAKLDTLRGWARALDENATRHSELKDGWLQVTKPALEGAGEWSHQYGLPDNSAFGGETLAGVRSTDELRIQWLGRPGPRAQPDRSGRKPAPLSINGRLFVQGHHRIMGVDAFNGTVLWTFEIPALERFNVPRDCGNWCADAKNVFVTVENRCWQIDAQTGKLIKTHRVLPGDRKDWQYDWGYVARVQDRLLGTALKQGTAFTSFWGGASEGWYDARSGPATFKVCSDRLFALDVKTGKEAWSYAKGVIINSTITATKDRVYFIETRHPKVKAQPSRRVGIAEMWKEQFLVTLDAKTGKKIYEKAIDTEDGIVVFFLAHSHDRLVLTSSRGKNFHVYALDAKTGEQKWKQQFRWLGGGDHGKAMSRPAIVGDKVFVRPRVIDLPTGELLPQQMPGGGCGTYAATSNMLIFRSGNVTLWSSSGDKTTSWNRLRPGCWLSTIPAGGMLLSPEGGGGCSCGSWMETSIGFMPRRK